MTGTTAGGNRQPVFTYENAKTVKGEALGVMTAIRYLAPSDESGQWDVCPNAGACRAVCLYTAGRGRFAQVKDARIRKTAWRMTDRAGHMAAAADEIRAAVKRAALHGMTLAVRMNGTSDLPGDALELARLFPDVQLYDYTKLPGSVWRYARGEYPANYHLTLSYDPETVPASVCQQALSAGVNVAVVFSTRRGQPLPAMHWGRPVLDGDDHDLRFKDPCARPGFVVGLRAKGLAKNADTDAFVVRVDP
jgi:hypothetical protein